MRTELVQILSQQRLPGPTDPHLGLPPKVTVTRISGGESYSIIPDRCSVSVDVRLTTRFQQAEAISLIQRSAALVDSNWPHSNPTTVTVTDGWPAYKLRDRAPIREALLAGAMQFLTDPVAVKVAGPSNIGNYLASLGIDATAGLGVRYEGLHGTDERIDLATVPAIQATYHHALLSLLAPVSR